MNVQSLGYRTDLIFSRFEGEVTDRGDYLVVQTPSNPTYYWGNYLLFAQPPQAGDYARWRELFIKEIGPNPPVKHMVFGIDGTQGEMGVAAPFLDAGFEADPSVILTARSVHQPPKLNDDVSVRALESEADWTQNLVVQIACFQDDHEPASYRVYAERSQNNYRAMIAAGLGQWFGAFEGDVLAASLGLFVQDGVGRFQAVVTHPDHRRRGICGRLVYDVARLGLTQMGADVLVMAADPEYHAARIYESIGFVPAERQIGFQWVDKSLLSTAES